MSAPSLVPRRRAHDVLASALVVPLGALVFHATAVRSADAQTAAAADTTGRGAPLERPSAPGAPDESRGVATSRTRALVGAAYLAVGGNGLPLGALDTRLRAAGLPGAAAGATTVGSGAYAVVARRLVVGASGHVLMTRQTDQAGWRTRVGGGYALGELGLAAIATPRTLLAVTGGLGASRVTAKLRPQAGGRFDSVAATPRRSLELGSHTVLAHAGVMADHAVRWRGKRTNMLRRTMPSACASTPTIAGRRPTDTST